MLWAKDYMVFSGPPKLGGMVRHAIHHNVVSLVSHQTNQA